MAILLISPEPWEAHTVSKHHYARTLASEGHRVLYLDPPVQELKEITIYPVLDCPGVEIVQAPRVAPGLRKMPGALRRLLERTWLEDLEQRTDSLIEVIWLFENSRFFDLRFAGPRLKIYHQMDLNQGFYPNIAAQTADICFCVAEHIRQKILPHNANTYFIQHGSAVATTTALADHYQARLLGKMPRAAYVGNLAIPYLDWDILISVMQSHLDVEFHLIGGFNANNKRQQDMEKMLNVKCWGQVESKSIPAILEQMDVLLLCYSQRYQEQVSNSHKLMEYLASGRTVVATYTEEYDHHRDLIVMGQPGSNAGYFDLFSEVLSRLSFYNSAERMASRRAFAADHLYPRQLKRIQSLLLQNGFSLPKAKYSESSL